jgi:sugar phosphate isomerase/epimerase
MKLGITGLLPETLAALDAAALKRIGAMGFTGTALPGGERPAEISTELAREVGRIAAGEGIEIVEYGQYQTTFIDPDDAVLAETLATVREACRVSRAVGCPNVIVGIGSLNPAGQWFPYAGNYSAATKDRLVGALGQAVKIAEGEGLVLALECHVTTTLRDAKTGREVLDAVGSPALKIHLDPVNWMTFETIYDNGPAIEEMYATLGPARISGAHSKGAKVENELIVHMNETYTGADDDLIDHAAVLRGLQAFPVETYLVIEHLTVEQMPIARRHLLAVAGQIGLDFVGQAGGSA